MKKGEIKMTVQVQQNQNQNVLQQIKAEVSAEVSSRKIDEVSKIALLKQVIEFKKIEALEKELDAAKKAIKGELTEMLKQAKVNSYQVEEYKINYSEFEKRTFDSKKFQAENEELYNQYLKVSQSSKFEIR